MKKERLIIAKRVGTAVLITLSFCYLFFIFFVVGTPEKAVIWNIFREGDCSYSEAKQAEIVLIKEDGYSEIYKAKIGQEESLWRVISFSSGCSGWLVTSYGPDQQFNDMICSLTRQDMVTMCVEQESNVSETEQLWKKYALMSDDQIKEQYKYYFLYSAKLKGE